MLVTALTASVVLLIAANLGFMESSRVKAESGERTSALMEGVMRIARESLKSRDELMLLSYLKFLMQEYPEIEIAAISREGHSSVLGEIRNNDKLFYRTITLTEANAASYRASPSPAPDTAQAAATSAATTDLPPDTFTIQLGFSQTLLQQRIRATQLALWKKISVIAAVGLLLGLAGSFWAGHLLARRRCI